MNMWLVKKCLRIAESLIAVAMLWACTSSNDDGGFAGGTTEDAGIIAELNVAGVTQKGPFMKGSVVTVQGINCKTLKFTDETFEGKVKSDKGDFEIKDVNLSSTCAMFEVSGYYLNEFTGKKSSEKLTLHALTNLKDRKKVNINVLTELEYERVMNLVTVEKMSFADAKKQAENEVLASFSIKGDVAGSFDEAEDLNILEKGNGNAALLAVSVMMLADANESKLAERLDEFSTAISKNGLLDDDAKTEIVKWASSAASSGKLDTIRKNIESWGYADSVPAFETYVKAVGNGDSVTLSSDSREKSSSSATSAGSVTSSSSSQNVILSSSEGSSDSKSSSSTKKASSSSASIEDPRTSYLNPNINYGEMTDSRDGQVYKTVKIGSQVWMAQNLNYETKDSYCYNDSTVYCDKYGRLYTWAAAKESCPSDWHLPRKEEWGALVMAVGGEVTAGKILRSQTGWNNNSNGTDAFGFSALPVGIRVDDGDFGFDGINALFWGSTESDSYYAYSMELYYGTDGARLYGNLKDYGFSVRCLKGEALATVSSSSSSVESSSSVALAIPCKTESEDNCEYGTLADERDGQTYKTVKIGDQWWMAENLNYDPGQGVSADSMYEWSWCFDDEPDNCAKYGRLYTWAAAMDSVKTGCGYDLDCASTLPVQGACPLGWHVPSLEEWGVLMNSVSENSTTYFGDVLKSQSGWSDNGNGTDAFGFSALPAGCRTAHGFEYGSSRVEFWGTDDYDRKFAYAVGFDSGVNGLWDTGYSGKRDGFSVRCVKD